MKELTNKEQYFIDCSKKIIAAELNAYEGYWERYGNDCIYGALRVANRMAELIFDENDDVREFSAIMDMYKKYLNIDLW